MQVAIVGLGIAGSYLAHRLSHETDWQIDAYERMPRERWDKDYSHVCAWGTQHGPLQVHHAQMHNNQVPLKDYLYHVGTTSYLKVKGEILNVNVDNLVVFQKPRWIRTWWKTANHEHITAKFGKGAYRDYGIQKNRYDWIFDATGVFRTLLPPIVNDFIAQCYQRLVFYKDPPFDDFYLEPYRDGYFWYIPRGGNYVHIGSGRIDGHPKRDVERFTAEYPPDKTLQIGNKQIRLLSPSKALPFVEDNIIGVGEAIGVVRPLLGGGICPALQCADLLMDHLHEGFNTTNYTQAVRDAFKGHEREYAYIQARLNRSKWKCIWHAMHLDHPSTTSISLRHRLKILTAF